MIAELAFMIVAVALAMPGLVVLIFELRTGARLERAADPALSSTLSEAPSH